MSIRRYSRRRIAFMNIYIILSALSVVLLVTIVACVDNDTEPTQTPAPLTSPTPRPTFPLATPKSQNPTAPICAEPHDPVVTITINVDVPAPRCTKVTAEQRLEVINRRDDTVGIELGPFKAQLAPGEAHTIDVPFGHYLEPGIHGLSLDYLGGSGPEIWLTNE
jgi:hypothetical protein